MDAGALESVLASRPRIVFGGAACPFPCPVLDAETVEVFTLERFKELIVSAAKEGRDFIIAEVTTHDPSTAATFRSHYSAIELNRILFCVEGANNLLYRVRAKNPVNNLSISGRVLYYKVTCEALKDALGQGHADGCRGRELEIKARYFASDEDLLFDPSVRRYFASNSDKEEYFVHRLEEIETSMVISEDPAESYCDDKFSLKIILYTNIGTILVIFGMCILLGSKDVLVTVAAPLSMTLLFSVLFLLLYILLFETPESLAAMFSLRKIGFGHGDTN